MAENLIANVQFRIYGWENNFPKYLYERNAEICHIVTVSILSQNGSVKLQAQLYACDEPRNF